MKPEKLFLMSWQNLRRNKRRVILSSLGIIFGLATLIFFFSLTNGARGLIFEHFLETLPANQLKVTPEYKPNVIAALGKLSAKAMGLKSSGADRDEDSFGEEAIEKIKEFDGVESVYGVMLVEAPAYVYIFSKSSGANSRVVCAGIEDSMLTDILPPDLAWTAEIEENEIPALLNPTLLAGWNEAFSASFDMPKLNEEIIKRIPFILEVQNPDGFDREYNLKIVGLSTRAPIFGPLIPMDFVKQLNHDIFPEYTDRYSTLYVTAAGPSYVPGLEEEITALGYFISQEQELAKQINFGIDVITLFLTSISLVIVVISLVNIVNIYLINVIERKYEIGVLRAVGATRWDIRGVILSESAVVGLANGLLGSLLGILIILVADPALKQLFGGFIPAEVSLFSLSPELLALVVVATPLLSMLAAFQPANYAARLDPVEALRR
jgi:ABC-type lipoprotein release transport system permease subunit